MTRQIHVGGVAIGGGAPIAKGVNVTVYDTSLTRTTTFTLSLGREYPAATSVGNYALFGGGYLVVNGEGASASTVDAFVVA